MSRPEPQAQQRPHRWRRPSGHVDDPWAWLSERDDPETIAYLSAENAFAEAWFDDRAETVETIFNEIRSRTQETDETPAVRRGSWWYASRMVEGSSYAIHCRGMSRETATDHVILDENLEAAGYDYFAVAAFDVNHDQTMVAWSSDVDGSEHYTLRIRDIASGVDLPDVIERTTWAGTAWSSDGTYVFYVTDDEQQRPFQVWRHRLGTTQDDDVSVFEDLDERFFVSVDQTRSGEWIIVESHSKLSSEAWLIPAGEATAVPRLVRARAENVEYSVDHWGDRLTIVSNLEALDFAVYTAPVDEPSRWKVLIPGEEGRRVTGVEPFATHLVVAEWVDAQPRLRILRTDGSEHIVGVDDERPHDIEFDVNPDYHASTLRFAYQSYTCPASVYEVDLHSGERTLLKQTPVLGVDLASYRAERRWVTAGDGTRVPVDVVRRCDVDQPSPTVVYAYGSYESSLAPWFSVTRLSLLDRGVVFAVAHPRGGGEMGRRWYLDGKLDRKRNTFTDTVACAESLIADGIARAGHLAVRGGSAGGLLVGACITMRPELFAAAVAEVPFVDVVTTMCDPSLPLTVTEWEEWGDPRTEPMASYIASYSPYDNTVPGAYPALYVTAGLNDPRVSYHEPAKWVAKLRAVRTNSATLLFHCEMGAGHGGPSGRYDAWRDEARTLAFLLDTL